MKNKKMLKVLSTSFILGTILMTNPALADKAESVSLNEKLVDNQDLTNSVTSETKETKVVSDDSEATEEKENLELTNDDNSKENSEKLELSSDIEKEAVKSEENSYPELILPEAKFDKDMNIDDPATYDYAGYVMKHYNPTNEKFLKEQNRPMFFIEDTLKDNTDKKNEKTVLQLITIDKGKDLSEKLDKFILELEKNKDNNKIDFDDIKDKVFGENPGFGMEGYFSSYLSCLYSIYNSTYQGDGDGHKLITGGKLFASDFSIESFKEIYKNNGEGVTGNGVIFTINNSFRNKPIIWAHQICLSEDQYFRYRDEIMDFIKSEAGFKNLTIRKTSISPYDYVRADVNSQKLPNNIKEALAKEYAEKNKYSSFDIVYDTDKISKDSTGFLKEDLKNAFDKGDFSTDKDVVKDESFSLRIGFDLSDDHKFENTLPLNYYLSKNDKPIFKGDNKLAFKEKGDIIGSEYYISNTTTDRDDFAQRLTKLILESSKDDEDFNKLTKKEQDEFIQSQIQENIPYIDEAHKDDKENIQKYQAFLNSEKWGNQRLTQYVGNVENLGTQYVNYKTEVKYDNNMAYGDYRVDQEGQVGEIQKQRVYEVDPTTGELKNPKEETKEFVKCVNKIITVGTNKDLVKKIKYNEKYSIEDPRVFSYTEHALRNIQPTNKGLQRNIYLGTEVFYRDFNGVDSFFQTLITMSDGDLITKDIDDYVRLKVSNKKMKFNDKLCLDLKSSQGSALQDISDYVDALYGFEKSSYSVKKLSSAKEVSDFILNKMQNGGVDNHIQINNNFKTPLIRFRGTELYVYLDKATFDEVYSNLAKYRNERNDDIKGSYSIQSFNNDFTENPKTVQSKAYDNSRKKHNMNWTIFEIRTNQLNKDDMDKTMQSNVNFLKSEKIYKIEAGFSGYTADELEKLDDKTANSELNFTLMNSISYDRNPYYFYYHTNGFSYVSDISLGFKQIVEENTDKKNVLAGMDYNVLSELNEIYSYNFPKLRKSNSKEDFKAIESFVKKNYSNYLKFLQSDKLDENRFSKLEGLRNDFAKNNSDMDSLTSSPSGSSIETDIISESGSRQFLKFLGHESWSNRTPIKRIGTVDTKIEEKEFKTIKKEDSTLAIGETKVIKKGVKGKKVTKLYYKLNRMTGELTDPIEDVVEDTKPIDEVILVGTKKVIPAKPIEDIATTTKVTKETIKAKVSYEADDTLEFGKKQEVKKPVDGEKEITSKTTSGKTTKTKKVIKDKVDGLTKVGNKKVEVETKDGITTTTTTIYEVEKETGKLINPKVTTHKSTKIGTVEDIATTTKTTKETIKAKVSYEADDTLEFEKQKEVKKAVDGEKEITSKTTSGKTTKTEKVIKDKVDGLTKVGNKKVEVKTKDGITTTTTTIYEVDKTTGKLVNPKVTIHKTTKIGTTEDITTTTKTTKEVIKAKIEYEADDTLEFEKQKEVKKAIDGEKEITSKTTSGKTTKTEKVIKDKIDGLTKVGNKKVEVETKDGITTTTTTIYEVDKTNGKLVNPKVTTHKTTKAGIIEDIAKKVIPATKIEDIAKKTIPATKIEDIAKKTNKNDEKDNSHKPKKDSHLPKAGVNSEILTLAVGALATIGGISLSKKRRK